MFTFDLRLSSSMIIALFSFLLLIIRSLSPICGGANLAFGYAADLSSYKNFKTFDFINNIFFNGSKKELVSQLEIVFNLLNDMVNILFVKTSITTITN